MELAHLFDRHGPIVSVYLNTNPAIENAAQHSMTRWRNVRRSLEEGGAPPGALDAIGDVVPDAHHEGSMLVAFADGEGLQFRRGLPIEAEADWARVGELPSVGALVQWLQSMPVHLLVQCDRVGADIVVFAAEAGGAFAKLTVGDDEANDPVLRKTKPGGWSQRRYQERAENAWEANAKDVVERLARLCDLVQPRAVFVHGDVRAVQLLKDHSPDRVMSIVREVDSPDDETLAHAVATVVAEDTVALLEKFKEERGQHDRAVDGVEDTLAALSEGRVATLLIHDDPSDVRECWFARDVPLAATTADVLRTQGVEDPLCDRLVDVAIRTAFKTSADVRIVPGAVVTDGLGALLRY